MMVQTAAAEQRASVHCSDVFHIVLCMHVCVRAYGICAHTNNMEKFSLVCSFYVENVY